MRLAAFSSLAEGASDVLADLAGDAQFRSSAAARTVLVELAGAGRRPGAAKRSAGRVCSRSRCCPMRAKPLATAMVVGLTEGLARSGSPLRAQIAVESRQGERTARRVAGAVPARSPSTSRGPPAERAEAIRTLGLAPFAENRDLLPGLLGTRQPQEVQLAALAVLARFADPEIGTEC